MGDSQKDLSPGRHQGVDDSEAVIHASQCVRQEQTDVHTHDYEGASQEYP